MKNFNEYSDIINSIDSTTNKILEILESNICDEAAYYSINYIIAIYSLKLLKNYSLKS